MTINSPAVPKSASSKRTSKIPVSNSKKGRSPLRKRAERKSVAPEPVVVAAAISPEASATALLPVSTLKSCLKSQHKPKLPVGQSRNVVFGSPKAVEFNKRSPTDRMTPLTKDQAKRLFSMEPKSKRGESILEADDDGDEDTEENSRILDEWDRLSNAPDDIALSPSRDEDEGTDEYVEQSTVSVASPIYKSSRRKSMGSADRPTRESLGDYVTHADLNCSEVSKTIALPSSLAELLESVPLKHSSKAASARPAYTEDHSFNTSSVRDVTEKLETNLQSLLDNVDTSASKRMSTSSAEGSEHSLGAMLGVSIMGLSTGGFSNRSDATSVSSQNKSLQSMIGIDIGTHQFNLGELTASLSYEKEVGTPMSDIAANHSIVSLRARKSCPFSPDRGDDSYYAGGDHEASFDEGITVQLEDRLEELLRDAEADAHSANEQGEEAMMVEEEQVYDDEDATERLEFDLNELVNRVATAPAAESAVIHDASIATVNSADLQREEEDLQSSYKSAVAEQEASVHSVHDISQASSASFKHPIPSAINTSSVSNIYVDEAVAVATKPIANHPQNLALLQRLKTLNADARHNSLAQCATPMTAAPGHGMSIGMKRLSTQPITSHKRPKLPTATKVTILEDSENIHPNATSAYKAPESSMKAKLNTTISLDQVYEHCSFTDYLVTDLSSFNLASIAQSAVCSDMITSNIVRDNLLQTFTGIFEAANQECQFVMDKLKDKDSMLWTMVPKTLKGTIAKAMKSDASLDESLRSISSSSLQVGSNIWSKWEHRLTSMAIDQIKALAEKETLELNEKMECEAVASQRLDDDIAHLKERIEAAKQRLEANRAQLNTVRAEISVELESKKNEFVSMVDQSDHISSATIKARAAFTSVLKRPRIDQAVSEHESKLAEAKKYVELLNMTTYCRLISYQAHQICLEAVLSPTARVELVFDLTTDNSDIRVDNVHVELVLEASKEDSAVIKSDVKGYIQQVSDRDNVLAAAFFANVLCADDVGILTEAALAKVLTPSDIAPLLEKVRIT